MTQRDKDRLTELGWYDIEEKMLPLGEKVNVMRVISRNHQQLWQQSFNSVVEVLTSGVTHWAKIKNVSQKRITHIKNGNLCNF